MSSGSNTTDQTSKTPQFIHGSSKMITSEIMLTTLHPLHISESVIAPQHIKQQWKSRSYTSSKLALKLGRFQCHGLVTTSDSIRRGRGGSNIYIGTRSVRKQNLMYVRKAHRRLNRLQRRSARAEIRTQEELGWCDLPDSPDGIHYAHQPTKVAKTTSIMEP